MHGIHAFSGAPGTRRPFSECQAPGPSSRRLFTGTGDSQRQIEWLDLEPLPGRGACDLCVSAISPFRRWAQPKCLRLTFHASCEIPGRQLQDTTATKTPDTPMAFGVFRKFAVTSAIPPFHFICRLEAICLSSFIPSTYALPNSLQSHAIPSFRQEPIAAAATASAWPVWCASLPRSTTLPRAPDSVPAV